MLKEKKEAVQDLNLRSPNSKSKTLPTILSRPAVPRGKFPLLILFEFTIGFLSLGAGAMLFVRSPITELE